MPNTVTAFIIIVAIFPGILGNKVYQMLVGINWREKEFQVILRLAGFSVIGAVLYAIASDYLGFLPPPMHLLPNSYQSLSDNSEYLFILIYPYIGHLAGGFISGILAACGVHLLARFSSATAYPAAWDDLVRKYVPKHWVVVGLKNGDAYAGKIRTSVLSVSKDDRDLVIEEPCLYDMDEKNYRSLNYQYLFIPSENLYSLAVIHNPEIDKRIIPVGENLFKGENTNGQGKNTTTAAASETTSSKT